MTTRRRNLAVLLAIAALGAGGFALVRPTPREPSALDAVPAQSFLVATIDIEALRASPLGEQLGTLGEAGIARVKRTCGFDPLERATELAIAIPEEEAPGEFGVVARADLTAIEVASCAEKLARERGERTRVEERPGGFTVVEEQGGERTVSRIALRKGGPLLVGAGHWLDAMMETVRTGRHSVRDDPTHTSLRKAVIGADKPAIVVSAILPRALRERLKQQMVGGATDPDSSAAMRGVLSVATASLAFSPGKKGGQATLAAELGCEGADECREVARLIDRKKRDASGNLRLRLVGVTALLDALKVDVEGTTLRATVSCDAQDFAALVGRLAGALGQGEGFGSDKTPAPAPGPDVVRSGDSPGATVRADERLLAPSARAAPSQLAPAGERQAR